MNSLSFYVPILLALVVYAVRMGEIFTKRTTVAGKVTENLTFRLFMMIGTVMIFGSIIYYWVAMPRPISWVAVAVGVVCAVVSFRLRWAAIAALGRFWSLHVEMRDNHEFVQSGPFRYMRHPTYFSMILELLAFGLICNAWWLLLIIPFAFIPALALRLRIEEAALVNQFGDAYRAYQQRVPMLVPYKWPSATS